MSAIVVVDALWGDSGKGKTCAHLTLKHRAELNVRAGVGTNAGASVTLEDGTLVKARQLPIGWVNPGTRVAVGPGVLVDPLVLADEVARFGLEGRAMIDGRCGVITPEHVRAERADRHLADTVGSTCTGNGHARADFVLRRAVQAKDVPALAPYVTDVAREVNAVAADEGRTVVVAGSQGTMLSLAFSPDYPYTTSGNCTAAAAMDDVGLNWRLVTDVVMVVKAMPTRVGAGPLPLEMSAAEAEARGIAEYGVHTGRTRRKAEGLDFDLLRYAAMLNGPTQIALTFCDHYDPRMRGARDTGAVTPRVRDLIGLVEEATGAPVTMVDTGPRLGDMIDLVPVPTG
ncbi:adenylosuccinate synthetase [Longispora fulva]|uniref:Adenylosuccinate synthetase n=1 Tax=Longispora fulva TaxID=619741 RepID=A0A8J7GQ33_9ACTN|nr:adenylosuccinate synthetase [Longispora fulva]MBG6134836.1 adenylosuccinate synthase [Longispora fulva]GIG56932.1 adenylosuccinate synthetase [Longispora fulva]